MDNANVCASEACMDDSEDNSMLSTTNMEDMVSHSMKHATKKKKQVHCGSNGEDNGYSDISAAILELSNKKDDAFSKILTIETTTVTTSKRIEKLLKNALKLHGLKEETNKDVRKCVINIFGKVAPGLHEYLEEGIDTAHPVGPKKPDGPHRSIIILFALRCIRDALWKNGKGCKFIHDNKLRITEALSLEDRSAREKLWPLVKKSKGGREKGIFPQPICSDRWKENRPRRHCLVLNPCDWRHHREII